jgi:hypothetical protein
MLALAAAAFWSGVPTSRLVWPVVFAPVQAAIWFVFVLPLALSPWGKRVIAEPVPGVANGVVFLGGSLVYCAVFLPVVRASYQSRIRARRRARGHCAVCGYDLTGNESGVCPECGTVSAAASTSPASSPTASTRCPEAPPT